MAAMSITGVSLILRYEIGTFTYSYLKPEAGDTALYEFGSAINSLQAEPVKTVSKIVTSRITAA